MPAETDRRRHQTRITDVMPRLGDGRTSWRAGPQPLGGKGWSGLWRAETAKSDTLVETVSRVAHPSGWELGEHNVHRTIARARIGRHTPGGQQIGWRAAKLWRRSWARFLEGGLGLEVPSFNH